MKVLYVINTGLVGGLQRHVLCLMETLKGIAETAVVINTEIEPQVVDMFVAKGLKVYRLNGKSGHDWRIVKRFRKVLQAFRPDIIHAHGLPIFCLFYLCIFHRNIPVFHSLHTPPQKPSWRNWFMWKLLEWRVLYWLPVSSSTWERFQKLHPKVKGEVFFNPVRIVNRGYEGRGGFNRVEHVDHVERGGGKSMSCVEHVDGLRGNGFKGRHAVVGMVGRNADQKDWPSFHKVERLVKERMPDLMFLNAGEDTVCDGRAAIAQMDLFIMTSKHEQLPTTVLECFALGTPICGFLPDGGTKDILAFSNGAVRDAFINGRDCSELARLVEALILDGARRRNMAEDGWNILVNHFFDFRSVFCF